MDALPSYLTGLITVLLLTSFIKIFTSLSILRYGLGLQQAGFGVITAGLALVLSAIVVGPQLAGSGAGGSAGFDMILGKVTQDPNLQQRLLPFVEKHARKDITARLQKISDKLAAPPSSNTQGTQDGNSTASTTQSSPQPASRPVIVASFVISELQAAFSVGLLLLVPFLVLDLVIANVLMALNVTQLPLAVVSLPLKLFVFFAVDGWQLVSEKLLNGYL